MSTNKKSFHNSVPGKIEIIQYRESHASYFKEINLEWLNHFYSVTPEDLEILDNPEEIINSGGVILFAQYNHEIAGTAALLKVNSNVAELIKMGVSFKMQGKGIGSALMQSIISEATKMGVKSIVLETAHELHAAIYIYSKFGFRKTSEEEVHPRFGRKTFKMEKNLEL